MIQYSPHFAQAMIYSKPVCVLIYTKLQNSGILKEKVLEKIFGFWIVFVHIVSFCILRVLCRQC